MNGMSNGSLPRRALHVRTGVAAALFGGFAVTLAACPGPTPHTVTDGSGGEGSTSTTTSSAGGEGSSSTSTSSSSGGMECTTLGDCPAPPSDCQTPTCEGTTCGFAPVAAKTPCKHSGGKLCDGAGQCVACITADQCGPVTTDPCSNTGVHTASPTCEGGKCEPGKDEDCEAKGLVCDPAGCMPCVLDADCGPSTGDCVYKGCKEGKCDKVTLAQGSTCPSSATSTCDATGMCVSRRYVFVTSMTFLPSFGGTAMADAKCYDVAKAAGLGGEWKSWTSDSAGSTPLKRFTPGPGPYMLLNDQTIVASSWAALTSGALMHGISLDEKQQQVMSPFEVWTGTNADGTYAGNACSDWKVINVDNIVGAVGISGDTSSAWSKKMEHACFFQARLYCFQQ